MRNGRRMVRIRTAIKPTREMRKVRMIEKMLLC
jgi:hypothetical protein